MSSKFYPSLRDIVPKSSLTDKYLILDLDETLVSTQDEDIDSLKKLNLMNNSKALDIRKRLYHFVLENVDSPGYGTKNEIWGITRPHLKKFLIKCLGIFKGVYVWSAGKKEYVDMIVDHIFEDLDRPEIIFTNDETKEKDGKVLKPLQIMFKKYPHLTPQNTFMLDDNIYAVRDNKDNAILLPAYKPQMTLESLSMNDNTLLQILKWLKLEHVRNCDDVRQLDKDMIFGIPLSVYKQQLKNERK